MSFFTRCNICSEYIGMDNMLALVAQLDAALGPIILALIAQVDAGLGPLST